MTRLFPFGFPQATAFYLTLYVLTFVLHQAFMHYVLAGSLYVAWATAFPGRAARVRVDQPVGATLRDWMPFLLSAAITAGIAPLLFIQIVYQLQFYTANLLLWWRWMLVVPVLIAAFYLLYLVKSGLLWRWSYPARVAVCVGTSLCFVFVGFCWTANHLLANSGQAWPEVYASGKLPLVAGIVIPRMLVWIGGSFTSMSVVVGWQLLLQQSMAKARGESSIPENLEDNPAKSLAWMSSAGGFAALLAGLACLTQYGLEARTVVFGGAILPYLFLTLIGLAVQVFGWVRQLGTGLLNRVDLAIVSVGCVCSLLGVSVVREGLRISSVDLGSLAARHAAAATVAGFPIFLIAAVAVSLVIAWCVRLVQAGTDAQ